MEIKTQPPQQVLYGTYTTTLNTIQEHVGTTPLDIYSTAAQHQLLPAGPQQWIYTGMTTDRDAAFTLEIALPVNGTATPDKYNIKELPQFKCAATIHKGSWDNLGSIYEQLIGQILQQGLQMTGIFREMYVVVDMAKPENNVTEVQAGII